MRNSAMGDREGHDLISGLPDDILRRLSSLLPLKDVVRTSTLSARWRSLWMPTQLNFRAVHNKVEEVVPVVVSTFLMSYEVPEAQKLCFTGPPGGADREAMTITATKGVEKDLHLRFSETDKEAKSYHFRLEPALSTTNLSVSDLRRLHLRSMGRLGSSFASALFSSCHFLESLSLDECPRLETLVIDKNTSLQELAISDCPNLESVSVCAMELKSFSYRGPLPKIELKSTSSLAEVFLDLRGGPGHGEFDCEQVLYLLESIKEVQSLTVSGWLLEWLCSAGVIYGKLDFQFSQLKELRWTDSSINSSKRDSLACFLNICPALEKLLVHVDHGLGGLSHTPFVHTHWHEPHLWRDYEAVKANVLPLKHLKVVRMVLGHLTDEEQRLSLMELLLDSTVVLESMSVITSE